jgi:hypothetical protein
MTHIILGHVSLTIKTIKTNIKKREGIEPPHGNKIKGLVKPPPSAFKGGGRPKRHVSMEVVWPPQNATNKNFTLESG